MIDVRVVEAVEVDEPELSVLQSKLDVVAADGGVVEDVTPKLWLRCTAWRRIAVFAPHHVEA